MRKELIYISVIITLASTSNALIIHSNHSIAGWYNSPEISWTRPSSSVWQDITGEMVWFKSGLNFTGKIVFLGKEQPWEKNVQKIYEGHGIAAVLFRKHLKTAGFLNYFKSNHQLAMSLQSVELGKYDGYKITDFFKENGNTTLNVTLSSDKNPWRAQKEVGSIFWSIIMSGLSLLCIMYASYKLYFSLRFMAIWSLMNWCLALEIFSNFVRFWYVVIDPLYSRRIFINGIQELFISGLPSFTLATTILIAFYWLELMDNSKRCRNVMSPTLKKFMIPAFVTISIFVVLDILGSGLRGFTDVSVLFMVFVIGFIIGILALVVFFLYSGTKILIMLRDTPAPTKSTDRMFNATLRIVISGCLGFLIVIPVCLLLSDWYSTPTGYIFTWTWYYCSLYAISLLKISAFTPKKSSSSSIGSIQSTARLTLGRDTNTSTSTNKSFIPELSSMEISETSETLLVKQ